MKINTCSKVNSGRKCHFCDSDATHINRFIVSTIPDDPTGLMSHDYFGEAIFTCDKHLLSCDKFKLGEQ